MIPVTIWSVIRGEVADYSHLEFGHVPHRQVTPAALTHHQAREWAAMEWQKVNAWQDEAGNLTYDG